MEIEESLDPVIVKARSHFEKYKCNHDDCIINDALDLAVSFAKMKEDDRIDAVRTILLALTAPSDSDNTILSSFSSSTSNRKLIRGQSQATNCTSAYAMRGKRVCRNAFIAIAQISPRALAFHSKDVSSNTSFTRYKNNLSSSRSGKPGSNRVAAIAFLRHYAEMNGMLCPSGSGNTEDECVRILPSDTTKTDVFEKFKLEWPDIVKAAFESPDSFGSLPKSCLGYSDFVKIWNSFTPWIKIARPGTDFCDTCTKIKNALEFCTDDVMRNGLTTTLESHIHNAQSELEYMKQLRIQSKQEASQTLHLIMDFAEKVLLPSLVKQPGQLHFVTGLKLDLFCISCANNSTNYVFNLPEGYWPGGKNANEVLSMLYYMLQKLKSKLGSNFPLKLVIHCDNCAGQNRNRFVLWFCSWLIHVKMFEEVELDFLVAGHTKNECDGSFGCIKKKLRRTNVHNSKEMRELIEQSSKTSSCVKASDVQWYDWKTFLSQFYNIPSTFKMKQYHQFLFRCSTAGDINQSDRLVSARAFSTVESWNQFEIMKTAVHEGVAISTSQTELLQKFPLSSPELTSVFISKGVTRKAYLIRNVCERYFDNNPTFAKDYFSE